MTDNTSTNTQSIASYIQEEIDYLTEHHFAVISKPKYAQVLQNNIFKSIESLKNKNILLDSINSEIITGHINAAINNTLDLNNAHITRFPLELFQSPDHVDFWNNLTRLRCANNLLVELNLKGLMKLEFLECSNNKLSVLDLKELEALRRVYCHNNELAQLNLQGPMELELLECSNNKLSVLDLKELVTLKKLYCSNNKLSVLDLRELMMLQSLYCRNNPLEELNLHGLSELQSLSFDKKSLIDLKLRGVHPDTEKNYAELARSLLFKQLSQANSTEGRQRVIARLGADYTYANCLYHCPEYAVNLFASDFSSTANGLVSMFSQLGANFLPSFNANRQPPMPPENERNRPHENALQVQKPKRD